MHKEIALENKIQQYSTKIEELEIRLESLLREEEKLLHDLQITREQLSVFVSNPENFTAENWAELNDQQKKMNEKLHRELENIRNPIKTKKAYDSLHVQSHWLYVK